MKVKYFNLHILVMFRLDV